ncbi:MAG: T9SS type A sorting domain-containing protein [Bacteroidota bacterium]
MGRIAHLLADMSVPAHCHDDAHSPVSEEAKDNYEQWVMNNYSNYTWVDALNQGGTIFDVIEKNFPIRYLMYIVNQYADFYPSDGSWMGLYYGDKNYSSTYTRDGKTDTYPILNSIFSNLGSIPTSINHTEQASRLIPFAIRATAGLLYLFAKEAGLLPIPITGVNVSGTDILYQGATGVWGAAPENGLAPYTHNWQIKYVDGTGYLQNFASVKAEKEKKEKEKKKAGDIIIALAPSNEWVPLYVNSDVLTRPHNPTDLRDYYLKCSVTDASGTTKTSNEWFVDVTSDPPPVNPPQTNTLPVDNMKSKLSPLAMEGEETVTYSLDNYPNPFNPATTISCSMPQAGHVVLKVYDVLGREVAELVNGFKEKGKHIVTFNASSFASGFYVYTIKVNDFFASKKMLLTK